MTEKNMMVNKAVPRCVGLQFKGSLGDWLGIGRLSVRPSEVIRKTLPEKSEELCLDLMRDEEMDEDDEMDAILRWFQLSIGQERGRIFGEKQHMSFREERSAHLYLSTI
jgi:hypothetical protein